MVKPNEQQPDPDARYDAYEELRNFMNELTHEYQLSNLDKIAIVETWKLNHVLKVSNE